MITYFDAAQKALQGDPEALSWLTDHKRNALDARTVIACDFDGTLCKSDYPEILAPYARVLRAVRLLSRLGYRMILWTCRDGDDLQDALYWLRQRHVSFDCVNANSPEVIDYFDFDSRKIYSDEYWDDKSVRIREKEEDK